MGSVSSRQRLDPKDWVNKVNRVKLTSTAEAAIENYAKNLTLRVPEHFQKKKTKDEKSKETSLVGEVVMIYEYFNRKEESYSGSAIMYAKLSDYLYVIKTAAHNMVQFRDDAADDEGDGLQQTIFPSDSYFYLQRKENKWKARFKIIEFNIYQEYLNKPETQDCCSGTDFALCLVELDDEDFSDATKKELNFGTFPEPENLKVYDESVEGWKLTILGYPYRVQKENGVIALANSNLYSDEDKIEKVEIRNGHGIVSYRLVTAEGHSGSALQAYDKSGNLQSIGVHCGSDNKNDTNVGVLITRKLMDTFIKETIFKYKQRHQDRGRPQWEIESQCCGKPTKKRIYPKEDSDTFRQSMGSIKGLAKSGVQSRESLLSKNSMI